MHIRELVASSLVSCMVYRIVHGLLAAPGRGFPQGGVYSRKGILFTTSETWRAGSFLSVFKRVFAINGVPPLLFPHPVFLFAHLLPLRSPSCTQYYLCISFVSLLLLLSFSRDLNIPYPTGSPALVNDARFSVILFLSFIVSFPPSHFIFDRLLFFYTECVSCLRQLSFDTDLFMRPVVPLKLFLLLYVLNP